MIRFDHAANLKLQPSFVCYTLRVQLKKLSIQHFKPSKPVNFTVSFVQNTSNGFANVCQQIINRFVQLISIYIYIVVSVEITDSLIKTLNVKQILIKRRQLVLVVILRQKWSRAQLGLLLMHANKTWPPSKSWLYVQLRSLRVIRIAHLPQKIC